MKTITKQVGRPKGSKNKLERKKNKKTYIQEGRVMEVFKDRTDCSFGLRKFEVIAEYLGEPINKIINLNKDKREKIWKKICKVKKVLNLEHCMSITSRLCPPETILVDPISGSKRKITQQEGQTYVYWRCSTIPDAQERRKFLDKLAEGDIKSAEATFETVRLKEVSEITTRQPMKVRQR